VSEIRALDGPRVMPAGGRPPRQLVVLLHGYGADGQDLIGLAPHWQPLLPEAAFVSPNAPDPCEMSPMGRQWFSLGDYDPNRVRQDPDYALQVRDRMKEGVAGVVADLDAFLDQELARHDLPATALGLVGFSQGTMLALYIGLRRPATPACILGFSGRLVDGEELADEVRAKPPVFLIHGDADEVVPVGSLFEAVSGLGAAGLSAEWHISQGIGHGIAPDGLELGGAFLSRHLN